MTVTLEDYRIQVIEQLKAVRGAARAHELLAEVDLVLASSRLSPAAQGEFWESLRSDLDVLEELKAMLGKEAAAAIGVVIAAARGAVIQYQRMLKSDETKSTD